MGRRIRIWLLAAATTISTAAVLWFATAAEAGIQGSGLR
jgi:hypothetical protein